MFFLRHGSLRLRSGLGRRQCQQQLYAGLTRVTDSVARSGTAFSAPRGFHSTRSMQVVKPVLLADIGEGIVECEIIQWFVEPDARVEEFSPLCEVQSDKASVEITSRFAGIVKKLHYEAGDMARVGKPFVDIDIQGGEIAEQKDTPSESPATKPGDSAVADAASAPKSPGDNHPGQPAPPKPPSGRYASLATPAVRHLSKQHNVDITEIQGTGKDGRVSKDDVNKFVQNRDAPKQPAPSSAPAPRPTDTETQEETPVRLTNMQAQMFKTMTRSLSIPHFLYADEIDFTQLYQLRQRLNKVLSDPSSQEVVSKLSYLPFVIKAVSLALYQYPVLNARVDVDGDTSKPTLIHRSQHNIGVAMDTPTGLVVPVIRNVGARNILSIASELARLQEAAATGRLGPADLAGGTITVSNIGNIGGTYLSPVIVEREVAILGVGRMRTVPAFEGDSDKVVKKQVCNFSWSADHRVVDGATMARAADVVRKVVEEPDVMVMHLR